MTAARLRRAIRARSPVRTIVRSGDVAYADRDTRSTQGDARLQLTDIGERLDPVAPSTCDDAHQDRRGLTAQDTPEKHPVFAVMPISAYRNNCLFLVTRLANSEFIVTFAIVVVQVANCGSAPAGGSGISRSCVVGDRSATRAGRIKFRSTKLEIRKLVQRETCTPKG